jgi:tetratricopeptide (TPR) repeat protein
MIVRLSAATVTLFLTIGSNAVIASELTSCSPLGGAGLAPPDQVIALCTKQIKSGKLRGEDLAWAYSSRADANSKKSNFELAIADYGEAIKLRPEYAGHLISRALVYLRKKDFKLSLDDYSAAIKIEPNNSNYVYYRAGTYMAADDFRNAIADYTEALRLKPDYPYYFFFRASAYLSVGDYDHAISDYTETIRTEPNDVWSRYLDRAWVYRMKGEYARALSDIEEAIKRIADKPRGYIDRGLARFESGSYDLAEADLARATQMNPNFVTSVLLHYVFSAHRGKQNLAEIQAAASNLESHGQNGIDLQVYKLFLGRMTPQELTAQLGGMSVVANCNVRAFVGEWHLLRKEYDAARQNFQEVDTNKCARWNIDAELVPLAKAELRNLEGLRSNPEAGESVKVLTPSKPLEAVVSLGQAATIDQGRRIALVIGNSAYKNVPPLANPVHDAEMVAGVFKRIGFEDVTLIEDLSKDTMVQALRDFAARAEKADWAVVYYAGHGMEVGGINYLIPVDARLATDRDIGFEAIPLDQVLNAAERASKLRLVILDACRDNPFKNQMKRTLALAASRGVSVGLAPIEPDPGTLVVYAAKGGEKASDGDGNNGPFALAFAKDILIPGLEVRRLFDVVRDDVLEITHREQQPFSYGSVSGRQDFYFIGPVAKTDQ